jgi:hypothetical protein
MCGSGSFHTAIKCLPVRPSLSLQKSFHSISLCAYLQDSTSHTTPPHSKANHQKFSLLESMCASKSLQSSIECLPCLPSLSLQKSFHSVPLRTCLQDSTSKLTLHTRRRSKNDYISKLWSSFLSRLSKNHHPANTCGLPKHHCPYSCWTDSKSSSSDPM